MMRNAFTLVELLVIMAITAIVASVFGIGVARLLSLEESNREEAFIREKLSMICGLYADYLSMGKTLTVERPDASGPEVLCAGFRTETGGVSFETGTVTRVTGMYASVSNGNFNIGIRTLDPQFGGFLEKRMSGDAMLLPVMAMVTDVEIWPRDSTNAVRMLTMVATNNFYNLRTGEYEKREVAAKRLFRLWNAE